MNIVLPFFRVHGLNLAVDLRKFFPELIDFLQKFQLPFPDVDQDILLVRSQIWKAEKMGLPDWRTQKQWQHFKVKLHLMSKAND